MPGLSTETVREDDHDSNSNIPPVHQENDSHAQEANTSSSEPNWGMRDPLFPAWTRLTIGMHQCLAWGVTTCALHATRYPKTYLVVISTLAIALQVTGYLTNFTLELHLDAVFTPLNSRPLRESRWIEGDRGFPNSVRTVQLIFHNGGANVLHPAQTRRVLEAVETIRSTPGYAPLCRQGVYLNFQDESTCRIGSVSSYWKNHSLTLFDAQVGPNDDDLLRSIVGASKDADGKPVLHDLIVGNYRRDNDVTRTLTTAQSYMVQVELPDAADADAFEAVMLRNLNRLRLEWMERDRAKPPADPTALTVDILTVYAFQLELLRTVLEDLHLIAVCMVLMVGFTCAIFARCHDRVQSRACLGLASVVTIGMSTFTGNGLLFLLGVPYSAVHQMLPFVVFGIGLDDTFIILGAYFRTNSDLGIEDRIRITMQEVGASITLTTFTTVFAFALGYFTSSLPGVHWLCLYAMTIIGIDFYYQITYFVACLVLDERRVQANKRDCCFWITEEEDDIDHHDSLTQSCDKTFDETSKGERTVPTKGQNVATAVPKPHREDFQDRMMRWYSNFLMKPAVKITVLVLFAALFGLCCYSASLLEQHFSVVDYVAPDSYLANVFSSLDDYSSIVRPMGVYFRNFDQLDAGMQQQMIQYVEDLEKLPQIGASNLSMEQVANSDEIRPFCWVRDLQMIEQVYGDDPTVQAVLKNMTLKEKLDFAMKDRVFREVYGADIVFDKDGNITASRCFLFLSDLDLRSVQAQVHMLFDQRAVSAAQPINQLPEHNKDWAMFSFNDLFFYWEAYAVAVNELITTIISGVISVAIIAFIFIPHWTAVCFVLPLIIVLYVDLLGAIRFFGLDINPLTYICVVVAIGLLVDFLMHVLLRFYETRPDQTREARVKETLQTMGVSILVGGFTTFWGVVPLCLSSVNIFLTVFYAFTAMVTLGVAHGLILLPVILSYCGPSTCVRGHHLAISPDFPRRLARSNSSVLTSESTVYSSAGIEAAPSASSVLIEERVMMAISNDIEV